MAGNKKSGKKYNPNKSMQHIDRIAQSSGDSPAASVLGMCSSMRPGKSRGVLVPQSELLIKSISILGSLDQLQRQWCLEAYRTAVHWYRAANYIAQIIKNDTLFKASCHSREVLIEMSNSIDEPAMTKTQYQKHRILCLLLVNILPQLPHALLQSAELESYRVFDDGLSRDFFRSPDWALDGIVSVIKGARIDSILPAGSDVPREEARRRIIAMTLIAHGLLHDSTVQAPINVTEIRRISKHIIPVIESLLARRDELDERLAA